MNAILFISIIICVCILLIMTAYIFYNLLMKENSKTIKLKKTIEHQDKTIDKYIQKIEELQNQLTISRALNESYQDTEKENVIQQSHNNIF